jgi:hypothetical protein
MTITRNVQWSKYPPTNNPPGYKWVAVMGPNGTQMSRGEASKWQLRRTEPKPGLEPAPAQPGS